MISSRVLDLILSIAVLTGAASMFTAWIVFIPRESRREPVFGKIWTPIWKKRRLFRGPGYVMYVAGVAVVVVAGLLPGVHAF